MHGFLLYLTVLSISLTLCLALEPRPYRNNHVFHLSGPPSNSKFNRDPRLRLWNPSANWVQRHHEHPEKWEHDEDIEDEWDDDNWYRERWRNRHDRPWRNGDWEEDESEEEDRPIPNHRIPIPDQTDFQPDEIPPDNPDFFRPSPSPDRDIPRPPESLPQEVEDPASRSPLPGAPAPPNSGVPPQSSTGRAESSEHVSPTVVPTRSIIPFVPPTPTAPNSVPPSQSPGVRFPLPWRAYHQLFTYANGVYMYGGFDEKEQVLGDIWFVEENATGKSEDVSSKIKTPGPLAGHSCTTHPRTKAVFCSGGFISRNQASNKLYRFDGKFTEVPLTGDFLARGYHASTIVDNFLYIFGGQTCLECSNRLGFGIEATYKIDLSTSTATPIYTAPPPRPYPFLIHSSAVTFSDAEVLLFGGATINGTVSNSTVLAFNPSAKLQTQYFEPVANFQNAPPNNFGYSAVLFNSTIVVNGGCLAGRSKSSYICTSASCFAVEAKGGCRSAATRFDDWFIQSGGFDSSIPLLGDLEFLNVASYKWETPSSLKSARSSGSIPDKVPDGQNLIETGKDKNMTAVIILATVFGLLALGIVIGVAVLWFKRPKMDSDDDEEEFLKDSDMAVNDSYRDDYSQSAGSGVTYSNQQSHHVAFGSLSRQKTVQKPLKGTISQVRPIMVPASSTDSYQLTSTDSQPPIFVHNMMGVHVERKLSDNSRLPDRKDSINFGKGKNVESSYVLPPIQQYAVPRDYVDIETHQESSNRIQVAKDLQVGENGSSGSRIIVGFDTSVYENAVIGARKTTQRRLETAPSGANLGNALDEKEVEQTLVLLRNQFEIERKGTNASDSSAERKATQATQASIGTIAETEDVLPFKVLHSHTPGADDELELQIGDIVYISKVYEDGWGRGVNSRTGQLGAFPLFAVEFDSDEETDATSG